VLVTMGSEYQAPELDPEDEGEAPPMSEKRIAVVTKLYNACDAGDGQSGDGIHINRLSTASVSYGPVTEFPLGAFEAMDRSRNGIVTLDEMMGYFQVAGRWMSDSEFSTLLTSLGESLGPEANADLIKDLLALSAQAEPVVVSEDEGEAPPMSEKRAAIVKALYDACDAGDGQSGDGIHIQRLSNASISYGPVTEFPLGAFEAMDRSRNGIVALDEMMGYFQVAGRWMSDSEFSTLIMTLCESIGPEANADLIKDLLALSAQTVRAAEKEEEEEEATFMSEERTARVKALYDVLDAADGHVGDGIHIKRLMSTTVSFGPVSERPFSILRGMDASEDGVVEYDEMTSYFQAASAKLSDDEFDALVTSLNDSVQHQ